MPSFTWCNECAASKGILFQFTFLKINWVSNFFPLNCGKIRSLKCCSGWDQWMKYKCIWFTDNSFIEQKLTGGDKVVVKMCYHLPHSCLPSFEKSVSFENVASPFPEDTYEPWGFLCWGRAAVACICWACILCVVCLFNKNKNQRQLLPGGWWLQELWCLAVDREQGNIHTWWRTGEASENWEPKPSIM